MLRKSEILVVLAGLVLALLGTQPLKAEESVRMTLSERIPYFSLDVKKGEPPAGHFEVGTEIEILQKFDGKVAWALVREVSAPDKKWLTVLPTPSLAVASQDESTVLIPGNPAKLNDLGFRLLRSQADKHENVVVSPYGLWSVLRLLREGAVGDTKQELEELIGTLEDEQVTRFKVPEFRTADCFLTKPDIELTPHFQEFMSRNGVERRNNGFGESERREFNKWVEKQTNGMIKEFVSPSGWGDEVEMVFANANALKAKWLIEFSEKRTTPREFHVSEDEIINVNMMSMIENVAWCADDDLQLQAVLMPYTTQELAAIILLPNDVGGLSKILDAIDSRAYEQLVSELVKAQALQEAHAKDESYLGDDRRAVLVPRFEIEKGINPTHALKLNVAQSNEAMFSMISESKKFKLSDVSQCSKIRVHEGGTDAASATKVTIVLSGPKNPEFRVDRPFLFLVAHLPTGANLFAATVYTPAE